MNPLLTDNWIIENALNSVIRWCNDAKSVYTSLRKFAVTFALIRRTSEVDRAEIGYIVDCVSEMEASDDAEESFMAFCNIYRDLCNHAKHKNPKYAFMTIYCRAKWEVEFESHIRYRCTSFKTMQKGGDGWSTFGDVFMSGEFAFV